MYDVAIVGLGVMGSACAWQLARRGQRVIGFDRFRPPHTHGSSHGRSRIIREAYFEHPGYVPLVQRAYQCWRALEEETGRRLLRVTGGVMLGPADGTLVRGAALSAETHRLPCERLTAGAIRERMPALAPREADVGLWEPRAGILDAEACVEAMLARAAARGATLRLECAVTGWERRGQEFVIHAGGESVVARRLVLAAGPWADQVLGPHALPLNVERQLMLWFDPVPGAPPLTPDRLPVFIWEWAPERFFYGIPDVGDGLKFAVHHEGPSVDPDGVEREVTAGEVAATRELMRRFIPSADGRLRASASCLYTNTPDNHFVIGPASEDPGVLLVSACSGHGFKFASAIGEVVADLITVGSTSLDVSAFDPARFA